MPVPIDTAQEGWLAHTLDQIIDRLSTIQTSIIDLKAEVKSEGDRFNRTLAEIRSTQQTDSETLTKILAMLEPPQPAGFTAILMVDK